MKVPTGIEQLPRDGGALLFEGFFGPGRAPALIGELDWQEEQIRMFGKVHAVPRLVTYYGERPYRYAGVLHAARPLPDLLRQIQDLITRQSGFPFNSVLGNYYRDGRDSMGYHRDNEPEIDPRCIASASFGATRRFKLRHRMTREVIDVDLADGSLLLMLDCQDDWEHSLLRTRQAVGGRVNLTYRLIRS